MAQKVSIVLIDDVDGTPATETLTFALDGVNYEIDLNDDHAAQLRESLAMWVGHARKVTTGRRARRTSAAADSGPSPKEIREWARANGFEVPDRGRVSAEVREAYAAAH